MSDHGPEYYRSWMVSGFLSRISASIQPDVVSSNAGSSRNEGNDLPNDQLQNDLAMLR